MTWQNFITTDTSVLAGKPVVRGTPLAADVTRNEASPLSSAELLQRITIRPEQCGGRPCVRGMRIRVIDVLELLAAGESKEQILVDFPDLKADDVAACLLYAARRLDHPNVVA